MKNKPLFQKVRISVYVPESTIAASVSIKEAGSNSYTIVPYNKTGKDYICSVSKSGVHTIRVEADGYETQKRRIRFPFQEKRIYFQLSPPGTKYTYFNGIKVPRPEINFDEPIIIPNGKKKRGGFKKDLSNAELLSELSGIIQDSSTKKKKSEFINPLHFDQKLSKRSEVKNWKNSVNILKWQQSDLKLHSIMETLPFFAMRYLLDFYPLFQRTKSRKSLQIIQLNTMRNFHLERIIISCIVKTQ